MDFSECICDSYGYCPIFGKTMEANPPNWQWCRNTTESERKKYFDILKKAPPSDNMYTFSIINQAKTKEEAFLYFLTLKNHEYKCDEASKIQFDRNKTILKYFNQDNLHFDPNDIEIACLGHSQKQFDSIEERSYIRKVNLNSLDAGEYSGNEWAETRAFLTKNLFSSHVNFVGFVTASWNNKYEPFSRIDNFHNWKSAKVLLNSKPEDKIILCADISCPCWWHLDQNGRGNILNNFFGDKSTYMGRYLLKLLQLEEYQHIKVPYSNQIITHKSNVKKYIDYLNANDILKKVNWFVEKIASRYINNDNETKYLYQNNRVHAYIMEMVSCFWFATQDFVYIPTAKRKDSWYTPDSVKQRISYTHNKNNQK